MVCSPSRPRPPPACAPGQKVATSSGALLDILRSTQHPLLNCYACLFSPPCSYPSLSSPVLFCLEIRQVGEKVAKSTGGNYPNATAIVDCIKFGLSSSKQVGWSFLV